VPRADIIGYQAWKPLNVRAECRVLIAYWSCKRRSRLTSFEEVVTAIQDVALKNPSCEYSLSQPIEMPNR
jgi:hypothetical protein